LDTSGKFVLTINSPSFDSGFIGDKKGRDKERAKAYSEGFLAGAIAVNQAADLVTTQGVAALLSSAGKGAFGAIGYGDSRYETGSHVNAKGYNLLAGLSASVGNASVGGFFETGDGDYDTHNSFSSGKVKGSGDLRYHGVGLLGRVDIAGGAYVEASLRAGRTKNDYKNNALELGKKFDTKSDYLGSHVGAGYVWQLNAGQSAEVYGKYLWTHQKGDTVRFDSTDSDGLRRRSTLKFSATDSQRLRIGGRYTWTASNQTSFFVGAAYEHEFDGDADAKLTIDYSYSGVGDHTNGKIKSPSLDGNVGIGELGLKVKPSVNSPVSIEAGLQGYGGDRKGATGYFNLKYVF
jgi:outer membrane autotransporter protein